jgi:hypothetical protein
MITALIKLESSSSKKSDVAPSTSQGITSSASPDNASSITITSLGSLPQPITPPPSTASSSVRPPNNNSPTTTPPGSPSPSIQIGTTPPRISTLEIAASVHSTPPDRVRDNPDFDYYKDAAWHRHFIAFTIWNITVSALTTVITFGLGSDKLFTILIPQTNIWDWLPVFNLLSSCLFVLNSLLIERIRVGRRDRWGRFKTGTIASGLNGVNFCYFSVMQLPNMPDMLLIAALGCWLMFSYVQKFVA